MRLVASMTASALSLVACGGATAERTEAPPRAAEVAPSVVASGSEPRPDDAARDNEARAPEERRSTRVDVAWHIDVQDGATSLSTVPADDAPRVTVAGFFCALHGRTSSMSLRIVQGVRTQRAEESRTLACANDQDRRTAVATCAWERRGDDPPTLVEHIPAEIDLGTPSAPARVVLRCELTESEAPLSPDGGASRGGLI